MLTRKNILFAILIVCAATFIYNFKTYSKKYRHLFNSYYTHHKPPRRVPPGTPFPIEREKEVIDKIHLAQNPQTSAEQLAQLAQEEDTFVQQLVARHPNSTENILKALLDKKDKHIAQSILMRPNLSTKMLSQLVNFREEYIQQLIARHPNTSPEILTKLCSYPSFRVVWEVACNPNSTSIVLTEAIRSNSPDGQKLSQFIEVRRAVARHSQTDPQILTELASDSEWQVRDQVASNPNTTVETRTLLTKDENEYVRQTALAKQK